MSGMEIAGLVLSVFPFAVKALEEAVDIIDKYDNTTKHSNFNLRQFGRSKAKRLADLRNRTRDAMLDYQTAHLNLTTLLATDAQERLSSAELARVDHLCKSSLALCSMLYAESDQLLRPGRKEKAKEASIDSMVSMILKMTDRMNRECAILEQPLERHPFDSELRGSSVYRDRNKSRQPTSSSGNPDDAFASDLDSQGTADSDLPTDPDSVSMGPFSYSFPEVPTISSTFEAGAEAVIDDPSVNKAERLVLVDMENGQSKEVTALLDTGATVNCVAEADVLLLGTEANIRKLPHPKPIRIANDEDIEATHVLKCRWYFPGKVTAYTHIFHIVPGLPRSLVICQQVIFQHNFLTENIELCSLGLPKELKAAPELYVLGMATQTRAKKEEQSQQAKAAMKANEAQRRQELEDMKQAFARRAAAAASSSAASASTQQSGSSSTQT
ncbi:hypothetical protein CB0940_04132 [Cercospora beticola]|uniref:Peptidase A2 domain-containing protein n=1 Tax=Cercospora beticola TaxID=122368 RepID=A0A2G5HKA1_CERBT|nr:hypothetical protein CB0940_04132 [Cercospora beticola]PIA92969.1 hypothetical protein CB0940_04132 [Cercospora beticola]WPB01347.1 hypothetical protein RHO25_005971 [Cercospora beticola]CAK1363879.1 unnamed protein product [Cercospora beticola]